MDTLNKLAKQYSTGKLNYEEYKRKRTLAIKNIINGKTEIKNHSLNKISNKKDRL